MYKEHEVTIEEVGNGFVVQSRGAAWETRVALTLDEALALAKELMLKPIPKNGNATGHIIPSDPDL